METIGLVVSIILVALLVIDIIITIKKLIDMSNLLHLIEDGEVSYIRAVKEMMELNGVSEKSLRRKGKAVPWSERNSQNEA